MDEIGYNLEKSLASSECLGTRAGSPLPSSVHECVTCLQYDKTFIGKVVFGPQKCDQLTQRLVTRLLFPFTFPCNATYPITIAYNRDEF